jgi:dephospho-CoA kinase
MPIIALTGNLGMGKTSVLRIFNRLGAYTFSADEFVRDILKRPATGSKLACELGRDILGKGRHGVYIKKRKVAEIIFDDPVRRRAVEKIIHPQVFKLINRKRHEITKGDPAALIVFEIPLLFEAGQETNFDKVAVVYTKLSTALNRIKRKEIPEELALRIMKSQIPITRKKKMADFRINNDSSRQKTEKRVKRIVKMIRNDNIALQGHGQIRKT